MRSKFERIIKSVWLSKPDFKVLDDVCAFRANVFKECHQLLVAFMDMESFIVTTENSRRIVARPT